MSYDRLTEEDMRQMLAPPLHEAEILFDVLSFDDGLKPITRGDMEIAIGVLMADFTDEAAATELRCWLMEEFDGANKSKWAGTYGELSSFMFGVICGGILSSPHSPYDFAQSETLLRRSVAAIERMIQVHAVGDPGIFDAGFAIGVQRHRSLESLNGELG